MIVYFDGSWLDEHEARVPVTDRGFLYGDAVFETARLHHGRYFRLAAHLERLRASAALLRIPIPGGDALRTIAAGLVDRNEVDEATLRITVTRGDGERPGCTLASLVPLPGDWRDRAKRGWRVITATTRRPAPSAVPPALKSLGRTYATLARFEAADADADDALMLTPDGIVAEGPTWNFFWRAGTVIRTPAIDVGILGGVTRGVVLELARELRLEVEEGAWERPALDDAAEAFATMTSLGVVPIVRLDDRDLAGGDPIAPELQERYWTLVRRESGRE